METSSISPLTQRSQLIATSSLDINNDNNTNEVLEFNKSRKKIDKIVKKINTLTAENAINKTPEQQRTTNIREPQVIFLDSSNSPNGESVIELNQTEQGHQTVNTPNPRKSKSDNKRAQREQAPTGDNLSIQMEPFLPTKTIPSNQEEHKQEEHPKTTQTQIETPKSPANLLIYKTPPSLPQSDTISDRDEDDIRALNEIQ